MSKYKIRTHELQWYWGYYEIEAESEEEAVDLVYRGESPEDLCLDCVDQVDIERIEEVDD